MAKRSDESLESFPDPVTQLGEADGIRVRILLAEAQSLAGSEARLKAIKDELKELMPGAGGVRHNNQCCLVRWQEGKSTMSKDLLIDNGVTVTQIEASMKKSKGYWVCELPIIGGTTYVTEDN